jgi:hypothetical protein
MCCRRAWPLLIPLGPAARHFFITFTVAYVDVYAAAMREKASR